jgi:hypothetical protein
VSGSGPLYEQGEAGKKAAEEPVEMPGAESNAEDGGSATGEKQAAENRENDPPA